MINKIQLKATNLFTEQSEYNLGLTSNLVFLNRKRLLFLALIKKACNE